MLPLPSTADRRPYLIANYQDGILREIPFDCPRCDSSSSCDVIIHSLRYRKIGRVRLKSDDMKIP